MSTLMAPRTTTTPSALARTGRAEWSRVWSVRSSWILALLTAAAVVGLGTLVGLDAAGDPSGPPPDATAWDGARPSAMFALFGILALSVVTSTADHATGAIVPTLQWTPRRGVLLAARVGVVVGVATLLGVALVAAASGVVWAFVPVVGLPPGQGAVTLGGLAVVYACCSLLAVGLGLALRSTAGALVTVIALVLVLPPLLGEPSLRLGGRPLGPDAGLERALPDLRGGSARRHDGHVVAAHPDSLGAHRPGGGWLAAAPHRCEPMTTSPRRRPPP